MSKFIGKHVFRSPSHALCWQLECTMASLEYARLLKRTSKSELSRLESIVNEGLAACQTFNLVEIAHEERCHRVERALKES